MLFNCCSRVYYIFRLTISYFIVKLSFRKFSLPRLINLTNENFNYMSDTNVKCLCFIYKCGCNSIDSVISSLALGQNFHHVKKFKVYSREAEQLCMIMCDRQCTYMLHIYMKKHFSYLHNLTSRHSNPGICILDLVKQPLHYSKGWKTAGYIRVCK